jgi:hypothetical protein
MFSISEAGTIITVAALMLISSSMAENLQQKHAPSDDRSDFVSRSGETDNNHDLVRTDLQSIKEGAKLFEQLCSKCHNVDFSVPESEFVMRGPGLKGVLKQKVLPFSKKPATAENIIMQLNKSFDKMPSFHFLSNDEQLNIIAYLNAL